MARPGRQVGLQPGAEHCCLPMRDLICVRLLEQGLDLVSIDTSQGSAVVTRAHEPF